MRRDIYCICAGQLFKQRTILMSAATRENGLLFCFLFSPCPIYSNNLSYAAKIKCHQVYRPQTAKLQKIGSGLKFWDLENRDEGANPQLNCAFVFAYIK